MTIKITKFAKDYKIPLVSTAIFIAVVLVLLLSRTIEYLALTEVLGKNNTGQQSYGALLSEDSAYELKKNQFNDGGNSDQNNTSQSASQSESSISPFTVDSTPQQTQQTQDAGVAVPGGGETGVGDNGDDISIPPTTPQLPFNAFVKGVRLDRKELMCPTGPSIDISMCSASYKFAAEIVIENGPGNITSHWHGGPPQFYEQLDFYASDDTYVYKRIVLACSTPSMSFGIQYAITSPNISQSAWLTQIHYCDSTMIQNG